MIPLGVLAAEYAGYSAAGTVATIFTSAIEIEKLLQAIGSGNGSAYELPIDLQHAEDTVRIVGDLKDKRIRPEHLKTPGFTRQLNLLNKALQDLQIEIKNWQAATEQKARID